MATPTYTAIASITLGSSASSVTFSSIPQNYRDLVLMSNILGTSNSVDGLVAFNNDTSNLTRVQFWTTGSGNSSSTSTGQSIVPRNSPGVAIIEVMDYSATNKHKTSLIKSDSATYISYRQISRWASNAAVTTITLTPDSGDWATGATFNLYGIGG